MNRRTAVLEMNMPNAVAVLLQTFQWIAPAETIMAGVETKAHHIPVGQVEQTGDFLILLGRSLSRDDDPFRLCTWNGGDDVKLLDLKFHQSMKPEGVTTYSDGDHTKLLVVDDRGGYAVVNPRHRWG